MSLALVKASIPPLKLSQPASKGSSQMDDLGNGHSLLEHLTRIFRMIVRMG